MAGGEPSWTIAMKLVVQAYDQSLWQLGERKHCSRTSKIVPRWPTRFVQQLAGVAQVGNTLNQQGSRR